MPPKKGTKTASSRSKASGKAADPEREKKVDALHRRLAEVNQEAHARCGEMKEKKKAITEGAFHEMMKTILSNVDQFVLQMTLEEFMQQPIVDRGTAADAAVNGNENDEVEARRPVARRERSRGGMMAPRKNPAYCDAAADEDESDNDEVEARRPVARPERPRATKMVRRYPAPMLQSPAQDERAADSESNEDEDESDNDEVEARRPVARPAIGFRMPRMPLAAPQPQPLLQTVLRPTQPNRVTELRTPAGVAHKFPSVITPKVGGGTSLVTRTIRQDEVVFSAAGSPVVVAEDPLDALHEMINTDADTLSPISRDLVANVKSLLQRKRGSAV